MIYILLIKNLQKSEIWLVDKSNSLMIAGRVTPVKAASAPNPKCTVAETRVPVT